MANLFRRLINRISNLINVEDEVEKSALIVGNEYHEFIVDWIKNRRYPLRRGTLPPNKFRDRSTGQLWRSQQKPRVERSDGRIQLYFENTAPHAGYFFEETRRDYKIPTNPSVLKFIWGTPWNSLDDKPPGERIFTSVTHPGTMAYRLLLERIFDREYKNRMSEVLLEGVIRSIE